MQETVYIWWPPCCKINCTFFCIWQALNLKLKILQRTHLSDGSVCLFWFFAFHTENVVFVPEKVCKIANSWVQWNQVVKVLIHIVPRVEKVSITSLSVLKCWKGWLSDEWIEKTVVDQNNCAWRDFTQKCKCSWIFHENQLLLRSVSCYNKSFEATFFGLVLGDCIVYAMIFINKYNVNLSRISFHGLFTI